MSFVGDRGPWSRKHGGASQVTGTGWVQVTVDPDRAEPGQPRSMTLDGNVITLIGGFRVAY